MRLEVLGCGGGANNTRCRVELLRVLGCGGGASDGARCGWS